MAGSIRFLLQVEALNLSSVLSDTRQLSVSRGANLLLRQAIIDLQCALGCDVFSDIEDAELVNPPIELQPIVHELNAIASISTGGSVGLFEVSGTAAAIKAVQTEIVRWLCKHAYYAHFTFAVDIEEIQGNFALAKERLFARIKFRQFQQWTTPLPTHNADLTVKSCNWDNLRPANANLHSDIKLDSIKRNIGAIPACSESALLRHRYGREQKSHFFNKESGAKVTNPYTWDLHELAGASPITQLNEKIALLSFDGNKFGSLMNRSNGEKENRSAEQAAEQNDKSAIATYNEFDQHIKSLRAGFLRCLIEKAADDPDFQTTVMRQGKTIHNAIRMELLQWGGDEFTLVVPAWKGMQVLQLFFDYSRSWKWKSLQLSHSASIVFCHVKTPIRKIQNLAELDMLSCVKDYIETNSICAYSTSANLYNYAVLESVDFPTQSYEEYLYRKFGKQASHMAPLRFQPEKDGETSSWDIRASKFRQIRKILPSRQLHRLGISAVHDDFAAAKERFEAVVPEAALIDSSLGELFSSTEVVQDDSSTNISRWLHALDLWDYYAPEIPV